MLGSHVLISRGSYLINVVLKLFETAKKYFQFLSNSTQEIAGFLLTNQHYTIGRRKKTSNFILQSPITRSITTDHNTFNVSYFTSNLQRILMGHYLSIYSYAAGK